MADTRSGYQFRILVSTLVVFYIVGFSGFFAHSLLTFPEGTILRAFYATWAFHNGLTGFMNALIPIHCAAIVTAYAAFAPRNRLMMTTAGDPVSFTKFISSGLALVLFLSFGYTVLVEGPLPEVRKRLAEMEDRTRIARGFLDSAEAAESGEDYGGAATFYGLYLSIDPANIAIQDRQSKAQSTARSRSGQEEEPRPEPEARHMILDQSAGELMERAENFYAEEDYFSAHYYANLAAEIDPAFGEEARPLAAKAWNRITTMEPGREETAVRTLYLEKRAAYEALNAGRYLEAYYRFKELSEKAPGDPDVERFYAESLEEVTAISFFIDDAEQVLPLPGVADIMFVNTDRDGYRELVHIGKLISVREGTYLEDIEIYAAGGPDFHLRADIGMIMTNQFITNGNSRYSYSIGMFGIDRDDPTVSAKPVYLSGKRNAEIEYQIELSPSVRDLPLLTIDDDILSKTDIIELWRLQRIRGSFGMRPEPAQIELLLRLLMPFTFLSFSFLAIGFGWAGRYRERKPSPFLWVFIVILPLAVHLAFQGYLFIHRIVLGTLVLSIGFWAGAAGLVAMQGLLFTGSLIYLAGQSSRR